MIPFPWGALGFDAAIFKVEPLSGLQVIAGFKEEVTGSRSRLLLWGRGGPIEVVFRSLLQNEKLTLCALRYH